MKLQFKPYCVLVQLLVPSPDAGLSKRLTTLLGENSTITEMRLNDSFHEQIRKGYLRMSFPERGKDKHDKQNHGASQKLCTMSL